MSSRGLSRSAIVGFGMGTWKIVLGEVVGRGDGVQVSQFIYVTGSDITHMRGIIGIGV